MKTAKTKGLLIIFLLAGFLPIVSHGEMNSTNYKIYADSFNAGGVYSTSTNYALFDSGGEWPASLPTSTNYEIRAGFQAMEIKTLAMTISDSALDLGALDVSSVKSDSANIIVTSTSDSGYTLAIGSAGVSPLTVVSDGTVTAGQEEYGATVSGADTAFADDRSIIAGRVLASSLVPVNGNALTFTVKAARSSTTSYGSKSQSITLTLSANF